MTEKCVMDNAMPEDLLNLLDYSPKEILEILSLADRLKRERKTGRRSRLKAMEHKTIAMIFEKPSLRTRVTFEVAMNDFGGYAVCLAPENIQIGARVTVEFIERGKWFWGGELAKVQETHLAFRIL